MNSKTLILVGGLALVAFVMLRKPAAAPRTSVPTGGAGGGGGGSPLSTAGATLANGLANSAVSYLDQLINPPPADSTLNPYYGDPSLAGFDDPSNYG